MKNFIEISDENEITLININQIVTVSQNLKRKEPSILLIGGVYVNPKKDSYEDLLEMIRKAAE